MPLTLASFAMGTRFELVLEGTPRARLRAAGEQALEEIDLWERRLSRFRSDSLVRHVERHAHERAVPVDAETFGLLEACQEAFRRSGGAFDVCVGARMDALGFGREAGEPEALAGTGADLELDPARRTVRARRRLRLDLGAVGKGFALDCARERLREAGVERALLHGGTSSVATLGAPPGMAGWRVALEPGPGTPLAELQGEALGVSAQHRRRNADGEGHVLDPRSGVPVATSAVAAVVAASGLLADAWSTALLVLGVLPPAARGIAGLVGEGAPGARRWRPCGEPTRAFLLDRSQLAPRPA